MGGLVRSAFSILGPRSVSSSVSRKCMGTCPRCKGTVGQSCAHWDMSGTAVLHRGASGGGTMAAEPQCVFGWHRLRGRTQ